MTGGGGGGRGSTTGGGGGGVQGLTMTGGGVGSRAGMKVVFFVRTVTAPLVGGSR